MSVPQLELAKCFTRLSLVCLLPYIFHMLIQGQLTVKGNAQVGWVISLNKMTAVYGEVQLLFGILVAFSEDGVY